MSVGGSERYVRHYLRSACDAGTADLKLVSGDGVTLAHKFLLLSRLPQLRALLCSHCHFTHDTTVILLPGVRKEQVDRARDDLYAYGDATLLAKLFGHLKGPHFDSIGDTASGQSEQISTESENRKSNVSVHVAIKAKKYIDKREDGEEDVMVKEELYTASDDDANSEDECRNESSLISNEVDSSDIEEPVAGQLKPIKTDLKAQVDIVMPLTGSRSLSAIQKKDKEVKETKLFFCDECKYTARYPSVLKSHKASVHIKEPQYFCDQCEFTAVRGSDFKNHQKLKHLGIFMHYCDQCEFKSAKKSHLTAHKRSVHDKLRVQCHQCPNTYCDEATLRHHIRVKHDNVKYHCSYCQFSTIRRMKLKAHIVKAHEGSSHF